jgi:hypothetical protein
LEPQLQVPDEEQPQSPISVEVRLCLFGKYQADSAKVESVVVEDELENFVIVNVLEGESSIYICPALIVRFFIASVLWSVVVGRS